MATDLCKQLRKVLSAKAQEQKALQEANTAIQSYTEQYDPRTQRMPNYATALITAQKAKQAFIASTESITAIDDAIVKLRGLVERRLQKYPSSYVDPAFAELFHLSADGGENGTNEESRGAEKHALVAAPYSVPSGSVAPTGLVSPNSSYVLQVLSRPTPRIGHTLLTDAVRNGNVWTVDPNETLPPGTLVAALTDPSANLWILATIEGVRPRVPNRPLVYEVVDDEEPPAVDNSSNHPAAYAMPMSHGRRKKYALMASRVIPLPSLAEYGITERMEFNTGRVVLALFPEDGVTTFYRAIVVKSARKRRSNYYQLMFDDDGKVRRDVDARFVIPLPKTEEDPNEM